MTVVINGSGTITGISTGGLPDGIVDDGTLATSAVTSAKIADGTITNADINASAAIVASKLSGTGKVLQVVQDSTTTVKAWGNTTFTDTNLSGSITPSSTSSKILVIVSQTIHLSQDTASHREIQLKLLRDGATQYVRMFDHQTNVAPRCWNTYGAELTWLDSPSTTSAVTYTTQMKLNGTTADTYAQRDNWRSTITLMEIA